MANPISNYVEKAPLGSVNGSVEDLFGRLRELH